MAWLTTALLVAALGASAQLQPPPALVLWPGARDLLRGNPWLNTVHQRNLLRESRWSAVRYFLGFSETPL